MLAALALVALSHAPAALACADTDAAAHVESGGVVRLVCADDARTLGLTVVDVSDAWAPAAIALSPYAATWAGLAAGDVLVAGAGPRAAEDRYFELWGIPPSLSVVAARLDDRARHACHALVHDDALAELTKDLRARAPLARKGSDDAANALQGHLVCDGFLDVKDADGDFGPATARALALWQRREALPSEPGVLDEESRDRLLVDSRARDRMALLRALRERVADAAGLIEDGSARAEQNDVVGLALDPPSLRPMRRPPALRGAGDHLGDATDLAARALGFDREPLDGAHVRAMVARGRVAVQLPDAPPWHAAHMELFARIDRGDVTRTGTPRPGGARPVFSLFAVVDGAPLPLVSWPTTIGGAQYEKLRSGEVVLKDKASPTGRFAWRYLWSAPAWFAPTTTPDDELVLRTPRGAVVNEEGIGPSYRSAYGLVMLQHHTEDRTKEGVALYGDTGVRTHGTGNVRSVLEGGVSHGCHRLLPRDAIRLAGFLLKHRVHGAPERRPEPWSRELVVDGARLRVSREVRGTRVELTPPVPVEVLEECAADF